MKSSVVICATFLSALCTLPLSGAEKMIIAIMEFEAKNVPRAEASKITELVRNEIINTNQYIVIERSQVDKILREQGFQMTGCTDVSCAVQMGRLLSARKILVGTVMRFDENTAITGRIVDVEKGTAEFAEKEIADSPNDTFGMVERFCDKLTERITGKAVKRKEDSVKKKKEYDTARWSYEPGKDPTLWLSVASFAGSALGFVASYGKYNTYKNMDYKQSMSGAEFFLTSSVMMGTVNPGLLLLGISKIRSVNDELAKEKKSRDIGYYVSGGLGGFGVAMLVSFLGRYAYYTAQNNEGGSGSIALFVPPVFDSQHGTRARGFNLGLGVSMRY